ncbi:MAG: S8 family serine peptidase [bacterium]
MIKQIMLKGAIFIFLQIGFICNYPFVQQLHSQNLQSLQKIGAEAQELTSTQNKVSSAIRATIKKLEKNGITLLNAYSQKASSLSNGIVKIDNFANIQSYVYVREIKAENINALKSRQIRMELINDKWNVIQAWIPFSKFDEIASLSFVTFIRPPDYALNMTGSVNTEGDSILKADDVRNILGIDGSGVKVGVISNGVDSHADAQATDDLPVNIEINPNQPGSNDEGTAMLEIIHDLAPGAQLAFSGPKTSLEMITAIRYLADTSFGGNGCDIIVDDIGFLTQPNFEDGPIAQTVDEVVAEGITYITAAGNQANDHYERNYVNGNLTFQGTQLNVHDFGVAAGSLSDGTMGVLVGPNTKITVFLQWNDPFPGSGNDYDLLLLNDTLDSLFTISQEPQNGTQFPLEVAVFENTALTTVRSNVVVRRLGASPRFIEMFIIGDNFDLEEYNVTEGSIVPGHQAAMGAITVGAINVRDPGNDNIEFFSSRGPARIFFPAAEERVKPDIAATDGNLITGAGGFGSKFGNAFRFFGTSSAAPHAAGVAALVLSANSNLTPLEIRNALYNSAVDLGISGKDNSFGAGRIDAFKAVQSVITNVAHESSNPPMNFTLQQNYPNPFNPTTLISYTLPPSDKTFRVKLEIFNTLGQRIKILVNSHQMAGRYHAEWDGRNDVGQLVASGLYIYRLQSDSFVQTKKMLLLR